MKKSFLLNCFLGIFSLFPTIAVAGTASHVSLSQYKRYNIVGALSFGDKLPAVGSHIYTMSQGATLQYMKSSGTYRVSMNNYNHPYVNLKHSGSGWYFPISKKDGEKARAILKNIHKCSNKFHGVPCVVQRIDTKQYIEWMTRYAPFTYVKVVKVDQHPANVHMDIVAVKFFANGNEATVKAQK